MIFVNDCILIAVIFAVLLIIITSILTVNYLKVNEYFLQTCNTLKKDFRHIQKSFDRRYIYLQKKYNNAIKAKTTENLQLKEKLAQITKSPSPYFDSGSEHLQNDVVNALTHGKHIFVTGGAGTGKTYFIGKIARKIATKTFKQVYVAAYSGMASVSLTDTTQLKPNHYILGLRTAHSVFKLPFSFKKDNPASIDQIKEHLNDCAAVIIDEISMMDKITFERLMERIPKHCGVMVVGDFFQLAPVPDKALAARDIPTQFAFESEYFEDFKTIQLETVRRQANPEFVEFLNEMRVGIANWSYLDNTSPYPIKNALKVFGTRKEVELENNRKYHSIKSLEIRSEARFVSHLHPDSPINHQCYKEAKKWFKECRFKEVVNLKVGLQVICLKNINNAENSLVNGDMGIIENIGMPDCYGLPSYIDLNSFRMQRTIRLLPYEFEYEWYNPEKKDYDLAYTICQYPIDSGYALTVHKTQGMTCVTFFSGAI